MNKRNNAIAQTISDLTNNKISMNMHEENVKPFLEMLICQADGDGYRKDRRDELIKDAVENFAIWKANLDYNCLAEFERCVRKLVKEYGME